MTDQVRALLERIGRTSEVASDSREARQILKEDQMLTMTCSQPNPEPPAPDSDYVRAIKDAMEIAAYRVPTPDGSRERCAGEIIHALGRKIDFGAL